MLMPHGKIVLVTNNGTKPFIEDALPVSIGNSSTNGNYSRVRGLACSKGDFYQSSFPIETQKSRKLFLRAKISKYFPKRILD